MTCFRQLQYDASMSAPEAIEPEEGYLDVTGGMIHYLDWGGIGLPAHFLHGNGFCAGTYSPFIRQLVGGLRVIASDVRGHGHSDEPAIDRIPDWGIFADDLATIVRRLLAPPVVGMGHSLGAVATAIAAATYPQLFAAVVLIDPVFLPDSLLRRIAVLNYLGLSRLLPLARGARRRRRTFKGKKEALKLFTAGRGIFKTWSPEFVEAYLECGLLEKDEQTAVLTCDPELEAQIFESIPLDVWSYVQRLTCPVLAIRGEVSDIFTPEAAERMERTVADCEMVAIPQSGHFPPMEKASDTARVILDFIGRRLKS